MNDGKLSEPKPVEPVSDTAIVEGVPPALMEYAKWLLGDARSLEVWGLVGTRLTRVECVADEAQSLDLDSGDWFLVRVSGVPTTRPSLPTISAISGIVRFKRIVGKSDHSGASNY